MVGVGEGRHQAGEVGQGLEYQLSKFGALLLGSRKLTKNFRQGRGYGQACRITMAVV